MKERISEKLILGSHMRSDWNKLWYGPHCFFLEHVTPANSRGIGYQSVFLSLHRLAWFSVYL